MSLRAWPAGWDRGHASAPFSVESDPPASWGRGQEGWREVRDGEEVRRDVSFCLVFSITLLVFYNSAEKKRRVEKLNSTFRRLNMSEDALIRTLAWDSGLMQGIGVRAFQ